MKNYSNYKGRQKYLRDRFDFSIYCIIDDYICSKLKDNLVRKKSEALV